MEPQYPLIFFTLFLCLSSGLMAFQGWMLYKGAGTRKFHVAMVVAEAVTLAVGGFSSFLHLHHWERLFNGFVHVSSGITQELIGIVVTAIVLIIVFVMLRKGAAAEAEDAEAAGDAVAAADAQADKLVPTWVAIVTLVVGIIMGFVCAHSYYMPSRPAWANGTLYLFYYSSEFILGATGTWVMAAALKQGEPVVKLLAKTTFIAGLVSACAMIICGAYYTTISFHNVGIAFHTTDPTAPAANPEGILASPIAGSEAPLFWGGAVVLGSFVVALLGFLGWRKASYELPESIVALICALAGGVCFRLVLYVVGVAYYVYF